MVRLVFRPYTQIWRSICTSESLRASIWVSSDFTLFRHSSPSFGSQQICSYSNLSGNHPDRSMMLLADLTSARRTCLHFHCACGFATQRLAYMLDSLVRVSRRVDKSHFDKIILRSLRLVCEFESENTLLTLFSQSNLILSITSKKWVSFRRMIAAFLRTTHHKA